MTKINPSPSEMSLEFRESLADRAAKMIAKDVLDAITFGLPGISEKAIQKLPIPTVTCGDYSFTGDEVKEAILYNHMEARGAFSVAILYEQSLYRDPSSIYGGWDKYKVSPKTGKHEFFPPI